MNTKFERIMVAVKPWEDRIPIGAARMVRLARELGAEVALTSCVRLSALSGVLAWTVADSGTDVRDETLSPANGEIDELERLAQPLRDDGLSVTIRVRSDPSASHGILDEVADWDADLLVAGVHEPPSSWRPRLATVDWQLMRLCPCPLLLARASNDDPYRTILAAVDPLRGHGEPEGLDRAIVTAARHFSEAFEAELRLVNVHPNPDDYEVVSSVEVSPGIFYGAENIESVHRQALVDLANACGVADSDLVLRAGNAAEIIAGLAAEPATDLIALGSVRRGRLEDALLGSTAERVIDEGRCDVLLVKPEADRRK